MSGEWDGLRAAAEAAPKIWLWYGGPDPTGDDVEVALSADEVRFISAAEPAVVLRVLDRLQAAEAAVERVRDLAGGLYWHGGGKGPDLARAIRRALDGPQGDATGEVAIGSTDEPREPQIAVQVCDHPGIDHDVVWSYCRGGPKCGVCKFIGHGPLCFDCYSASGAESDHGGRRDGEGLA